VQRDLLFVINDGLMSIFFLLVGLEIRRERTQGALADRRVALLPVLAALGGVTAPALIYLLVSGAGEVSRGWAVPTATDIAFAVGVLSLLGRRVPVALRLLLLTLAIVDDIAAIVIIAVFYSGGFDMWGLAIAAAGVLALALLVRLGLAQAIPSLLAGTVIWYGLLDAGVHPTLAGVMVGAMTPVRPVQTPPWAEAACRPLRWLKGPSSPVTRQRMSSSPCTRLENALHPWVAYLILPLFALANAGVSLQGLPLGGGLPLRVAAGIVAGLALGKPLGIILASTLARRTRLAPVPSGIGPPDLLLLGCLGGIGFTMALFMSNLAFTDPVLQRSAKLAVLVGSALSATLSLAAGRLLPRRP
jgi:NhaA family Na+:H+ antiporter